MSIAYTIAGFSVGAIVGLTGVGGGSLMTPLLVLLFGINPSVAVGTDLLYAAITKAGGTLAHGLKGTVDWTITRHLAMGSIPAAALTLLLVGHFAPGGIGGAAALISTALHALALDPTLYVRYPDADGLLFSPQQIRTDDDKYRLQDPSVLDSVEEFGDHIQLQILSVFPGFILQQIHNCLAVRHVVPRGVDRIDIPRPL